MYFFFLWHLKAYPEGNGFKILNFESSKENVFILASETSTLSEVAMNFEKNLNFPPHAAFSFAIKSSGNWILKSDAFLLWNYLGDKPNHFHTS